MEKKSKSLELTFSRLLDFVSRLLDFVSRLLDFVSRLSAAGRLGLDSARPQPTNIQAVIKKAVLAPFRGRSQLASVRSNLRGWEGRFSANYFYLGAVVVPNRARVTQNLAPLFCYAKAI